MQAVVALAVNMTIARQRQASVVSQRLANPVFESGAWAAGALAGVDATSAAAEVDGKEEEAEDAEGVNRRAV